MSEDLQNHLQRNFAKLQGDWVKQNSAYEAAICNVLTMELSASRYWDAKWQEYLIEFKKGTSIWLDLVRYSDVLLNLYPSANKEVLSLFFVPDKLRTQIIEIVCVDSASLVKTIGLTGEHAEMLLTIKTKVPRSLNAQASLTLKDIRQIQIFSVKLQKPTNVFQSKLKM